MLWADPPTVELRLTAERRYDDTPRPQPMLDDYIDMDSLGHSDRGQLREMAVTRRLQTMAIVHFALPVRDVRRSVRFFEATLGWRSISRPGNIAVPSAWLEIAPAS